MKRFFDNDDRTNNCSSLFLIASSLVLTSFLVLGCNREGDVVTVDGIKYVLTKNGVVVLGVAASVRDLDVPNEIYGLPVLAIGDSAFSGCSSLESIDIPDSVTTIGGGAFSRCSSLESIDLPDSVTTIGDEAFDGCPSLTIRAPKGSFAEEYAKEKKIKFEAAE